MRFSTGAHGYGSKHQTSTVDAHPEMFTFFALVVSFSGTEALAVNGPSFDCSNGVRQTLAVILCTDPAAAQADWDVNRAYWALFTDDRRETPPLTRQSICAAHFHVSKLNRNVPDVFSYPRLAADLVQDCPFQHPSRLPSNMSDVSSLRFKIALLRCKAD